MKTPTTNLLPGDVVSIGSYEPFLAIVLESPLTCEERYPAAIFRRDYVFDAFSKGKIKMYYLDPDVKVISNEIFKAI